MRSIAPESFRIPANSEEEPVTEKCVERLGRSILADGLKFPPIVKQLPDGTYTLIAGERRARALCFLAQQQLSFICFGERVPPGFIPVIATSDISLGSANGSTSDENSPTDRLTWKQQAAAIAELHALRSDQASVTGTTQTVTKTATEIKGDGTQADGFQVSHVTEALILATYLEDSDVAIAETQEDAIKILQTKKLEQYRAKLATEFDQVKTNHTLHHGDALVCLRGYNRGYFNCILTDPPHEIEAESFGSQAGKGYEHRDNWKYTLSCYTALAKEGFRITKENATLYTFCDINRFAAIKDEFMLAGWDVWPVPLIWAKTAGVSPRPNAGPWRAYEAILMATKGNPPFFKTGSPDVIICLQPEEMALGVKKPVDLYVELLSRSTLPGDFVLDCFAGSGTIFPAADRGKVIAHGIEINEEYYRVALTRMSNDSAGNL
jgi:site-specific DNA-methyltransferase (adenine-specific)